jgi:hypothetical protein
MERMRSEERPRAAQAVLDDARGRLAAETGMLVFLADMHMIRKPQLTTAADQLVRLPTKMLGIVVRLYGRRGSRYYYSPGYYHNYAYSQDGDRTRERRRNRQRRETDKTQV